MLSPLDVPLYFTTFSDQFASNKVEEVVSLRSVVERIETTLAPRKAALPWLKLAKFGEDRSQRGSLRHDENLLEISGVEIDYDGQQISVARAEKAMRDANLAALIYTSPSHTQEKPRWRVLCPTSRPMPPATRAGFVARLNGLFAGALAPESFTLSQAYYMGAVAGAQHHTVVAIEGRAIDLADDLDAGAIGRGGRSEVEKPPQVRPWSAAAATGARPWSRPVAVGSHDAGVSSYAAAALHGACDDLRYAGEGGKHIAINKAAYSVGGLVSAGEVPEGEAFAALTAALVDLLPRCKDTRAAKRTLERAFDDGKRKAREVPELTHVEDDLSNIAPFLAAIDAQSAVCQRAVAAKPLAVSPDLMDVEGALKLFVDYCEATAISPQPFLALAAAICAIGALAGRKYRTRTDLRTNIYAVGIADSGGGKDHARNRMKAVLGAAGLTAYMGGEDIASGTAMMTALSRHPCMLFQIDEVGDWLGDVLGPKAVPHKKQIAQRLKTLYSSANSFIAGTEYADQSKMGKPREDIQQPHACMYGTTTPGQFWKAIATGSLEDGLLARFLIFVSPESYPDRRRPMAFDPPAALVSAFKEIADGPAVEGGGNLGALMVATTAPEPLLVGMTDEAEAAYDALDRHVLDRQRKHAGTYVTAIAGRLAENTAKLALVRAVSRDPHYPVIGESDMAWGRALAEHCIDTLLREAGDNVAETPYERNVQAALKLIRKHGPATEYELFRKGWKIPDRDRREILHTLAASGQISARQQTGGDRAGKPTTRYSIAG